MSEESGSLSDNEQQSPVEQLHKKHRKEKKLLQANIQKLKTSVPKGDKKKKKEVQTEITRLEEELSVRQEQELDHMGMLTNDVDKLTLHGSDQAEDCKTKFPKKTSKAQRKRDKKTSGERERERYIQEQEAANLNSDRNLEAEKLKAILNAQDLIINEVVSDGNCLYAAVEDQLKRRGIHKSVCSLRQETAAYMREHPDDFLPFLSKPSSEDAFTAEEYDRYCMDIETTAAWGGQLEIQALANVLKYSIEIVQADLPSIIQGQEFTNHPPLILSYHRYTYCLGEHYNSVIPRPGDN